MTDSNEDYAELIPTLADWLDRWEAATEAGQTTISKEEAERRYYERYGVDECERGNQSSNQRIAWLHGVLRMGF